MQRVGVERTMLDPIVSARAYDMADHDRQRMIFDGLLKWQKATPAMWERADTPRVGCSG